MLADLDALAHQAMTGTSGRGGRRPGAGRKRKDGTKPNTDSLQIETELRTAEEILARGVPDEPLIPDMDGPEGVGVETTDPGEIAFRLPANPAALFAGAKARKEAALAAKAELDFRVKAGLYLPREAVRAANATAYQAVAQALRSIPDNLERKLGLDPDVAERVGIMIDATMSDLAEELERINEATYDGTDKD